ncbi:tyrosine-type recombinase/integrase [Patescibacteria group bacterium]|nr:tyrosine-type recombinase/integrase [Patescibacteria group bacterium]
MLSKVTELLSHRINAYDSCNIQLNEKIVGPFVHFSTPSFATLYIGDMLHNKNDIEKLIQNFLIAKQVEGKSKATLSFYSQNLTRFLWWLKENNHHLAIEAIDTNVIRTFFSYVHNSPKRWQVGSQSSQQPASMATVDAYWRTLQSLFSWLIKEGAISPDINPIQRIPRPRVPVKVIQDIPLELIKTALDLWDENSFVGARNRAIIIMLLDTGMRLMECAGLSISDIYLEKGYLKIWGKGQEQRWAHLGSIAKKALKQYLEMRSEYDNNALWLNLSGKPFSRAGIQTMIRRLSKLGGNVRWSPHTFRNTFSIGYLRAGGDPFTLQILGGWKDLEMPRRYCAALKVEDAFRVHEIASPADKLSEVL